MDVTNEKYFLTRGKAILFFLLVIVIIIIILVIKNGKNNKQEEYIEFEDELRMVAQNYYENYYVLNNGQIENGSEKRIQMNTLKNMGLIYSELKNTCSGYVVVSSEKNISNNKYEISFRPYIKCSDKYMTPNYSEY